MKPVWKAILFPSAPTEVRTRGPDEVSSSYLRLSFLSSILHCLWNFVIPKVLRRRVIHPLSAASWQMTQWPWLCDDMSCCSKSELFQFISSFSQLNLLSKGAMNYTGWSCFFHQGFRRWKTRQISANMTMVFGYFSLLLQKNDKILTWRPLIWYSRLAYVFNIYFINISGATLSNKSRMWVTNEKHMLFYIF